MTNRDKKSLDALSSADPAKTDLPPEKGSLRYSSILEAAMRKDQVDVRERDRSTARSSDGRWYLRPPAIAAATAIAVAGAVAAVMIVTAGPGGVANVSTAQAQEAVKRAAANTTAGAESGSIEPTLRGPISTNDGAQAATGATPEITEGVLTSRVFSWNGSDLAVQVQGYNGEYEVRYVGGHFYDRGYFVPDAQGWSYYPAFDNRAGYDPGPGAAGEAFVPANWLTDYRSALMGSGLTDLVGNVSELTATTSDGGTIYAGTLDASKLSTDALGLSGFPFAGQPLDKLRLLGTAAPVTIEIRVGSDGLIASAKLAYEIEGNAFTYQVTYSQLGSGPAIAAPDASETMTADSPFDLTSN
jgi:hypothetical protein